MNEKTHAEYETLKAAWSTLPGVTEDVLQREDAGGAEYRYLTLTERVPRDIATVCGSLMRLGTISVQTGAYLTMHVIEDDVHVSIAVRCNDVDPSPDAAVNVAREMLVDASGRYNVGLQPCKIMFRGEVHDHECPKCSGARAWCDNCHSDHHAGGWDVCKPHADQGVTPDERAGLGVGGGKV